MNVESYEFFSSRFGARATEALTLCSDTAGRCANLCALVSLMIEEDKIPNKVCLGSLSCNGVKAFQYVRAFPINSKHSVDWGGHAWIELPHGYIGEPSLLRTARTLPLDSNIRNHLEYHGLLERGAMLLSRQEARDFGLKYTKKKTLPDSAIVPLAKGLIALNEQ